MSLPVPKKPEKERRTFYIKTSTFDSLEAIRAELKCSAAAVIDALVEQHIKDTRKAGKK